MMESLSSSSSSFVSILQQWLSEEDVIRIYSNGDIQSVDDFAQKICKEIDLNAMVIRTDANLCNSPSAPCIKPKNNSKAILVGCSRECNCSKHYFDMDFQNLFLFAPQSIWTAQDAESFAGVKISTVDDSLARFVKEVEPGVYSSVFSNTDEKQQQEFTDKLFKETGGRPWTGSLYVLMNLLFHICAAKNVEYAKQVLKNVNWITTKSVSHFVSLLDDYSKFSQAFSNNPLIDSIARTLHLLAPCIEHQTQSNIPARERQKMIWENIWNRTKDIPTFDQSFRVMIHNATSMRRGSDVGFVAKWPILACANVPIPFQFKNFDDMKITSVAFLEDNLFACAGNSGKVYVVNSQTHECEYVFEAYTGWAINSLSYHERILATGGSDGSVKLWRVEDFSLLHHLKDGHTDTVRTVHVRSIANGIVACVSCADDGGVVVWDTNSGAILWQAKAHTGWCLDVSALCVENRLFIASCSDDHSVHIWNDVDVAGGKGENPSIRIDDFDSTALTLCWGSVQSQLFVGFSNNSIFEYQIVDGVATQSQVFEQGLLCGELQSLVLSGMFLVSASSDCMVRVWNYVNGKQIEVLKSHSASVNALSVVAKNERECVVLSGSDDSTAIIWEFDTSTVFSMESDVDNAIQNTTQVTALSEDHKNIYVGTQKGLIYVFDLEMETFVEESTMDTQTSRVSSLIQNDDVLVSGGYNGEVIVWCKTRFTELHRFKGHVECVSTMTFVGENFLASGSIDHNIMIWNFRDGKSLGILKGHTHGVSVLAEIDNLVSLELSNLVISSAHDATIRVWNLATRHEIRMLTGHAKSISQVITLNNLKTEKGHEMCVSIAADDKVIVWDIIWGHSMFVFDCPGGTSIVVNQENGDIFGVSNQGGVYWWNIDGAIRAELHLDIEGGFQYVCLSRNNGYLVVGGMRSFYVIRILECSLQLVWDSFSVYGTIDSPHLRGEIAMFQSVDLQNDSLVTFACKESGFAIMELLIASDATDSEV